MDDLKKYVIIEMCEDQNNDKLMLITLSFGIRSRKYGDSMKRMVYHIRREIFVQYDDVRNYYEIFIKDRNRNPVVIRDLLAKITNGGHFYLLSYKSYGTLMGDDHLTTRKKLRKLEPGEAEVMWRNGIESLIESSKSEGLDESALSLQAALDRTVLNS